MPLPLLAMYVGQRTPEKPSHVCCDSIESAASSTFSTRLRSCQCTPSAPFPRVCNSAPPKQGFATAAEVYCTAAKCRTIAPFSEADPCCTTRLADIQIALRVPRDEHYQKTILFDSSDKMSDTQMNKQCTACCQLQRCFVPPNLRLITAMSNEHRSTTQQQQSHREASTSMRAMWPTS